MRILLCINTILESSAVPGDFSVAFISTPLHDTEFIKPPIKAESDSRYVWKLRKALNDLKKASQLFSNYLSDMLVDNLGFEKCPLVPTAFYHRETDLRTAIHVDDPLTIGEGELRETRVGDHRGRVRSGTHSGRVHWESDGRCLVGDTRHRLANPPNSGAGGRECHAGGLRGYPSPSGWEGTTVVNLHCEQIRRKLNTRLRFSQ